MFKILKKIVMAFTADNLIIKDQPTASPRSNQAPQPNPNDLDIPELEFLLKAASGFDLKGHQVELFYRLIVKLQNQYIEKTKK